MRRRLEEPDRLARLQIDVDVVESRPRRQPRDRHDVSADRIDEAGAHRSAHLRWIARRVGGVVTFHTRGEGTGGALARGQHGAGRTSRTVTRWPVGAPFLLASVESEYWVFAIHTGRSP